MNENNNPNINQNIDSTPIIPNTPNPTYQANTINQFSGVNQNNQESSIPTRSEYHQPIDDSTQTNQYQGAHTFNQPVENNPQTFNNEIPTENINNSVVSSIPGYISNSNQVNNMNSFNNNQPVQQPMPNQEPSDSMNNFSGGFDNNIPPVNNNINLDEPDDTFAEPKKKSAAPVIIIIILLLLIAGAGAFYYFIYDTPDKVIASYTEKMLSSLNKLKTTDKYNMTYSVDYTLTGEDETYKSMYEILNKFTFTGSLGKENNKSSFILNSMYQNTTQGSVEMLYDDKLGTLYAYNEYIYDKPIKFTGGSSTTNNTSSASANIEELFDAVKEVATDTLISANSTKTYTKLNNQYVKKITLILDKTTIEKFYKGLLNSDKFMSNYSKITFSTEYEISEKINEKISSLKDTTEELSLYVGIVNNEFIMFEDNCGADHELKITKKDNTYSFEYSSDYTLNLQGKITITKNTTGDTTVALDIDLLQEKIGLQLNFAYKIDYTKGIDNLDITNAVDYNTLPMEDVMEITNKLLAPFK